MRAWPLGVSRDTIGCIVTGGEGSRVATRCASAGVSAATRQDMPATRLEGGHYTARCVPRHGAACQRPGCSARGACA